jgi:hypothetical protein
MQPGRGYLPNRSPPVFPAPQLIGRAIDTAGLLAGSRFDFGPEPPLSGVVEDAKRAILSVS